MAVLGGLVIIVLAVALIAGLVMIFKSSERNGERRIRAEFAPELLAEDNLDQATVQLFIDQKKTIEQKNQRLESASEIFASLLERPEAYMLGEHLEPIKQWIGADQIEEAPKK